MPVVVVTISKKGETKVEVEGGDGSSCTLLTKQLEDMLGQAVGTEYKGEYHTQPQHIKQQG